MYGHLQQALRLKLDASHPVPVKGDVTAFQLLASKVHSLRWVATLDVAWWAASPQSLDMTTNCQKRPPDGASFVFVLCSLGCCFCSSYFYVARFVILFMLFG